MYQFTRYRWLEVLLGLMSGVALTMAILIVSVAWYLDHLGFDAPILWDGYGVWLGALAVSLLFVMWLQERFPVFAGAMLLGASLASLLLVLVLWLLDNGIGFSG